MLSYAHNVLQNNAKILSVFNVSPSLIAYMYQKNKQHKCDNTIIKAE